MHTVRLSSRHRLFDDFTDRDDHKVPILSTGIFTVRIRGAKGESSDLGAAKVAFITSSIESGLACTLQRLLDYLPAQPTDFSGVHRSCGYFFAVPVRTLNPYHRQMVFDTLDIGEIRPAIAFGDYLIAMPATDALRHSASKER